MRYLTVSLIWLLAACGGQDTMGSANTCALDIPPQDLPGKVLGVENETRCTHNEECVVIPGVCGISEVAHVKDAACQAEAYEHVNSVMDCQYMEQDPIVAACIDTHCVSADRSE